MDDVCNDKVSCFSKVIPIIVTFNPNLNELKVLLSTLSSFILVKLIDNGSVDVKNQKKILSQYLNVQAIFLDENIGIAEAQNIAIQSVETNTSINGTFIFLLDQDSVPISNCIEVLYESANQLKNEGVKLGVIGPALIDSFSDSRFGFNKDGKRYCNDQPISAAFECDDINSSGSLIPLNVWRELRGNKKELFIDHVETDWCFRARVAGYVCYGTFSALLLHSMGESTLRYWLFGWRKMPDRAPERHYYLFRNSMFLQKQQYVPKVWKWKNILKLLLTMGYFGVFHRQRIKHISDMYLGIKDGLKNRLGVKKKK